VVVIVDFVSRKTGNVPLVGPTMQFHVGTGEDPSITEVVVETRALPALPEDLVEEEEDVQISIIGHPTE
jgi:hypothetical protein